MKLLCIAGARPNFMKIAPILRAIKNYPQITSKLIHTGQHYDAVMSDIFFKELQMPDPDIHMGVGGGSHAQQTADLMLKFDSILVNEKPDYVLVVGDVNSTMACAVTASKLHVPVIHVEAGLRSFDRTMPEEINRLVTDAISDYLFTTESSANQNLKNEGKQENQIFFAGNVMIDSLTFALPKIEASDILQRMNLKEKEFVLVTLHRPANVDSEENLRSMLGLLEFIAGYMPVVFPVHPRTKTKLTQYGMDHKVKLNERIRLIEPLGYFDFIALMRSSVAAVTGSGGVQEETTFLGVPCLTMRANTERPVTLDVGTNTLVGQDRDALKSCMEAVLNRSYKKGNIPALWDGMAAERIAEKLKDLV
ncbi:MAG TPA: UDP-N-acetylglucosamine 2-epimerase (non-hydrolyzing) [bacterium]|nr:UDP-N-acetylglucosamine 2-epimerase (non-hydrolyzing) [bacterium]